MFSLPLPVSVGGRGRAASFGCALSVLVVLAATPGWSMPLSPNAVRLVITGDPGAAFEGLCTVIGAESSEAVHLTGTVPFQRDFAATGLNCQIAAWGR